VAGAPFGDALAPRCATMMPGRVRAPPPSDESTREALVRQINDNGWLRGGGSVLGQIRTGDGPI
jgi:hypothetical protein